MGMEDFQNTRSLTIGSGQLGIS